MLSRRAGEGRIVGGQSGVPVSVNGVSRGRLYPDIPFSRDGPRKNSRRALREYC